MELRYPCKIVIVYYFLVLTDHDFISIFFLLKNIELRKNYEYKFSEHKLAPVKACQV